jgi:hypothetical protein
MDEFRPDAAVEAQSLADFIVKALKVFSASLIK